MRILARCQRVPHNWDDEPSSSFPIQSFSSFPYISHQSLLFSTIPFGFFPPSPPSPPLYSRPIKMTSLCGPRGVASADCSLTDEHGPVASRFMAVDGLLTIRPSSIRRRRVAFFLGRTVVLVLVPLPRHNTHPLLKEKRLFSLSLVHLWPGRSKYLEPVGRRRSYRENGGTVSTMFWNMRTDEKWAGPVIYDSRKRRYFWVFDLRKRKIPS